MTDSRDAWLNKPFNERLRESLYPLLLCACRFILSLTQFSVAIDTFVILKELNRMSDDNFDVSLTTIADGVTDYNWVPTLGGERGAKENYGTNKVFNLFIIRLIHYFRRQLGQVVLYPAAISLLFMTILSAYDIFEIFQSRWPRSKLRRIRRWLQTSLYVLTFTLITLQLVTLLYESSEISHMEVVYSFLFAYNTMSRSTNPMLMKTGIRSIKYRLVACIIFNIASLVPDTYLILVRMLQPLRLYAIVNSMKIANGLITLGAFVMICILRYYILASLNPKVLGDATTLKIMEYDPVYDANDYYPNSKWKFPDNVTNTSFVKQDVSYLPAFIHGRHIDSRVLRTLDELKLSVANKESEIRTMMYRLYSSGRTTETEFQTSMAMYAFVQNAYAQIRTALDVMSYLSVYLTMSALGFGVYAFLMVLRRHKLYVYINMVVDLVAIVWQVCNIIMTSYPMLATEFFCDAATHLPGTATLNFETNAVFTWMCRSKSLATLLFGLTVVQTALFLSDVAVLYLLWR
ncbi:hypothetical protein BaOVIS_020460 [Babesia ovis]|uniref:Uncharacterized protein n=1 Tax=Babesia ovis TaxID=5869 RepID=A0A9W5WVT1_BABOV|nr:hypothetical protein BaOVIS_020460 [Babesia ovis]